MKVQQFLEHQGLQQNPFSQEDAQTDPLFQQHCSKAVFHPAWDKIYGNPDNPATAVVFGEKGAGKTALRLQMVEHLTEHNRREPQRRVFVVEYDDFNTFLDRFHERQMSIVGRSPERTLSRWRLWDHMDAIMSLAVTQLVDDVLTDSAKPTPGPFEVDDTHLYQLSRPQQRDIALLAAYYDRSTGLPRQERWNRLRSKVHYQNWRVWWDFLLGVVVTMVLFGLLAEYGKLTQFGATLWPWLVLLAGWGPWLIRQVRVLYMAWQAQRQLRVLALPLGPLQRILASFELKDLVGQPAPSRERTDDRYELLGKLQSVLRTLGFASITVLVDRVDEPHLINGSPERMRDLLWPLFDNKLLKHDGLGFKLLLPIEVSYFLTREDKEFYERSRLDKQNLIRSLEWTGESLYDLANDRISACAKGQPKTLKNWFEDSITEPELVSTLGRLRVPRHLFRFLHQLLVEHCNRFTDAQPRWQIARETLQSTLALYLRDLDALDRGLGAG